MNERALTPRRKDDDDSNERFSDEDNMMMVDSASGGSVSSASASASADGQRRKHHHHLDQQQPLLASPPRSTGRRTRFSFGSGRRRATPNRDTQSRRLFDDHGDGDAAIEEAEASESCISSLEGVLLASPPRHSTLQPLNLNNDLSVAVTGAKAEDVAGRVRGLFGGEIVGSSSSTAACSSESTVHHRNAHALLPPQQGGSRKRTSAERHGPRSGEGMSTSASPKLSPNSYLTMDGRFVTSRNPFSSPMITEDETQYDGGGTIASSAVGGGIAGPSLPNSMGFLDGAGVKMPSFPPPRPHSNATTTLPPPFLAGHPTTVHAASSARSLSTGYPDQRFSFSGSPIQEDDTMDTTESTSGGSLRKVRRYNRSDDVVAASGLHLSSRRRELRVDTTQKSECRNNKGVCDDDISPTEVTAFPPPTPVKAKPSRSPYASIRLQGPTTPIAERRRMRNLGARSPYPGSYPQEHHFDDHRNDGGTCKSRFYADFDVIGELGQGSFGTVYKVLSRLDGCMYAIKAAQRKARGISDREHMLRE